MGGRKKIQEDVSLIRKTTAILKWIERRVSEFYSYNVVIEGRTWIGFSGGNIALTRLEIAL